MMNTKSYKSAKELLTVLIKTSVNHSKKIPIQGDDLIFGERSLGESISPFYQFLGQGLPEAVGNSQRAWDVTDPKYRMNTRDDMAGMLRKVPVVPIPPSDDLHGTANAYYSLAEDKAYVDPKGPHLPGSQQHELGHAFHERPPPNHDEKRTPLQDLIYRAKRKRDFNRDFKKHKVSKDSPFSREQARYLSQKGELAVRLSEIRRRYAYIHGVDVTNPEVADKALDWYTNANSKDYEKGVIEPMTQAEMGFMRRYLKDQELMRRLMPTTTQNNKNNRARRTYAA